MALRLQGSRVSGLGFRGWGLVFRFQGFGSRVMGRVQGFGFGLQVLGSSSGFGAWDLGFRVWCVLFRVWGLGLRGMGLGVRIWDSGIRSRPDPAPRPCADSPSPPCTGVPRS